MAEDTNVMEESPEKRRKGRPRKSRSEKLVGFKVDDATFEWLKRETEVKGYVTVSNYMRAMVVKEREKATAND